MGEGTEVLAGTGDVAGVTSGVRAGLLWTVAGGTAIGVALGAATVGTDVNAGTGLPVA